MAVVFFWLLFSVLVGALAGSWGRSGILWFIIAAAISPLLAVIILLVTGKSDQGTTEESTSDSSYSESRSSTSQFDPENHEKKCPDCAERIKLEARVCRYCGHEFEDEEVRRQIAKCKEELKEDVPEVPSPGKADARCSECNTPLREGTKECPECGVQLVWN